MGDDNATPSLANMPKELMKVIAEQAGYMSIQRLRLVNHDFKDFIDESKLDFLLNEISIQLQFDRVSLTLKQGKDTEKIVYKQHEEGTEIQIGYRRVVMKELNFLDVFFDVLKDIIKKQIPTIEKLNIELIEERRGGWWDRLLEANNIFVERLQGIELPEGQERWKVTMIRVVGSHDHTARIFSMADPNYLKRIEFLFNWGRYDMDRSENVLNLEQWKSAKDLYCLMRTCEPFERLDVEKFSHFEKMEINILTVTSVELDQLIKSYIENPNFKSSVILYHSYQNDEPIDYDRAVMVENHEGRVEGEVEYYYRIPYSDYALFHFFSKKRSRFARVPLSRVPPNVELKDAKNL